jgi:hypothetical protein
MWRLFLAIKPTATMKPRFTIGFLFLFAAFALTSAFAETDAAAYLNDYESSNATIRAGFIPDQPEVVLGEPLRATFLVENVGATNFDFWFGGDYRGTGRHDRFKIAVTNAAGEAMPDPIPHPMDFGGFVQHVELAHGQSFSNVLQLTDFRVIDKPGVYTVSCSFPFDEQWRRHNATNPTVNTTFTLTILERTPQRVAKVLEELMAKAQSQHGQELGETLSLMARFGGDDAVSRFQRLITNGPVDLRTAALTTLPQLPGDAALGIALANLHNADPKICAAAAGALGAMQKPAGVNALLEALPESASPVSEAILRALGASQSAQAFPVITQALDGGGLEMQRAAIEALVNFGGTNAVAVLQQHINTNFLSIRYELVLALAEKLHQPMQAEWLVPVLAGRELNHEWLDSLRLLRIYGGDKAIPTLLSCLDFDAAWSNRNWWILNQGVKYCANAPSFEYIYECDLGGRPGYPDGTPQMWTNNLRTLERLKPLAGPIPSPTLIKRAPVPYLKTAPPIDFVPVLKTMDDDGVEMKCGFLSIRLSRTSESDDFTPTPPFKAVYELASQIRKLPNANPEETQRLNLTSEQRAKIAEAVKQFAMKLCGAKVSDLWVSNFYNLLVNNPEYCPTGAAFFSIPLKYYQEAPDGVLKDQAKADFLNDVQVFSQNYHSGTVELVDASKKILSREQISQLSR